MPERRCARALLGLLVALGCGCSADVNVVDDDGAGASNGPGPNGAGGIGSSGAGGRGVAAAGGSNAQGLNGAGGANAGSGGASAVCDDFGTPCTACVAQACPADWCMCTETNECPLLFVCADGCNGDEACNQQCLVDHEAGISAAFLVSSCAGGPCAESCPQGGETLNPCSTCIFQSCAEPMNACLVVPDCLDLWNCLKDCPQLDLACQQTCYDTFGDGVDVLQPVLDCTVAACQPVCGD